jgi:hypothetical protein
MISNIIYIFGIIITIICIFTYIVKKYYIHICNFFNILKPNDNKKISERVEILKNKYNIKSTEKTNIELKFIVKKPTYLKINKINDDNKKLIFNIKGEFKNLFNNLLDNNNNNKNIINSYIYNKKIFTNLFLNKDGTYKINDLDSFNIYQNKKFNNEINSNILLKFYNKDEYLYIFVNNDNLIKIINNDEYDCITNLIENKNNIFLIEETISKNKINFITHGGYTECDINKEKIKKIFFNNCKKLNKNFDLLIKFTNLKIFFYISTQIN